MGCILLTPQLTDSLTHFSPVSWLRNKGPAAPNVFSLFTFRCIARRAVLHWHCELICVRVCLCVRREVK